MRIALAQIESVPGDLEKNIAIHLSWVNKAAEQQAELLVFPELSLSGYEPQMASALASNEMDNRLAPFQEACEAHSISIALGMPYKVGGKTKIGLILFQPKKKAIAYAKQILHSDEKVFFSAGTSDLIQDMNGEKIAFSICYESMQAVHLNRQIEHGASLYIASVAKSVAGINQAHAYFSKTAKKCELPILLCNAIGKCSEFTNAGMSAVWNKEGKRIGCMGNMEEGLIFFDTESKKSKVQ